MLIHELDTPAVVCDLDKVERNIRDMASLCRDLGIPLRVHTKSSKIPEIAHMQLSAGAIGICCQKLGDAEVMVAGGVRDILVPYNVVGPIKVERLMRLARRANITVAVDSLDTAQGISDHAKQVGGTVGVIIECDTGGKRCGVQTPEDARMLARRIVSLPGLDFRGLMTFPTRPAAKEFFAEARGMLEIDGIPCKVLSGGGTGLEALSKEVGCNEQRSGSYLWEHMTRIQGRADISDERCPLRVICTVVSTPTSDRVIVDGGIKTFTTYGRGVPPYGLCVEYPEATMYAMSVEHGHVDVSNCDHKFRVGERLQFIPMHQEITLNMHDELVGYRGEQIEVVWPVAGRGRVK
jgi:D-serine deaminase-like pyridoxal phosphate-dependent protein